MNSLARELLATPDGIYIERKILSLPDSEEAAGRLVQIERSAGQAPLLAWVTPLVNGVPTPKYRAVTLVDPARRQQIALASLEASFHFTKAEMRRWPTAEDAARLLDMQPSAVRQLVDENGLMSADVDGTTVIPPWQITGRGQLLPGLREILSAVPNDYGPYETQTVMTAPAEELDGLSPSEALLQGHPVPAIVEWVRWLGAGM